MTSSLGDLGNAFGGSAAASLGNKLPRRGGAPAAVTVPAAGLIGMLTALPAPQQSQSSEGPLSDQERESLRLCEEAIRTLPLAFVVVGKALAIVSDGELYRENYKTFADYLAEWDLKTSHAYRLMESWRLGEALALSPMGDKINERQVRELLPVAARHGQDAAVTIYRTVAEETKVTAALLSEVVAVVSRTSEWDETEAVARIRAHLAGELQPAPVAVRTTPPTFAAKAKRVRAELRTLLDNDTLRQAAQDNPAEVRELVAELRAALAAIEPTLGDAPGTQKTG